MTQRESLQIEFYQKLGTLFYAIAASDKSVNEKEHEALSKLIVDEWKSQDDYTDPFGTDASFQMESVFDWFEYEQMEAEQCFETFSDFYKEHNGLFTDSVKRLVWKTANAIASAFAGINKSELIMLTKLKLLMKNEDA